MNGGVHEGAMLQALWREAGRALPEFGLSPTSSYGDFLEFYAKFCALQQVCGVCVRARFCVCCLISWMVSLLSSCCNEP